MTDASTEPRLHHVQCLDSQGLHRMAYWEWGASDNPKVVICVHGLSRQGRDFDKQYDMYLDAYVLLRYVPRSMEHAPHINVVLPLKVKDEVRITCQGPKAQTGQIQFVRITR